MKLVMTLLVRDEEDILEWNLRYHLSRGVDHVVLTDNRSTDRSRAIARGFESLGKLTYIFEPADDYSQDLWVTRMARIALEDHAADWVIHCDADEFWWPENGGSLKEALGAVRPECRAVKVGRSNFLGEPDDDGQPFFVRMVHREVSARNFLGEPLPSKVAHRYLKDPYIHQGNHALSAAGETVVAEPLDRISIFHYPARSPDQLRRKIASGGAAYNRNSRLATHVGLTWREMYKELLAGRFAGVIENQFLSGNRNEEELIEDHRLRAHLERI